MRVTYRAILAQEATTVPKGLQEHVRELRSMIVKLMAPLPRRERARIHFLRARESIPALRGLIRENLILARKWDVGIRSLERFNSTPCSEIRP